MYIFYLKFLNAGDPNSKILFLFCQLKLTFAYIFMNYKVKFEILLIASRILLSITPIEVSPPCKWNIGI